MPENRFRINYHLPRLSGLCVFIFIYSGLFVIVSVFLFGSLYHLRKSRSERTPKSYPAHNSRYENNPDTILHIHHFLDLWGTELYGNETNILIKDNEQLLLSGTTAGLRWPYNNPSLINCTSLKEITNLEFIAAGWTKAVYKGQYRGQDVALKTVNVNGYDIKKCQKDNALLFPTCYRKSAAKIFKEIIFLTELAHENIVKVLGFCVPEEGGPITLVTELGEPLDSVRLLQLSWEDRLRLVLGIARILHHMANSPLGSLSMNDFRRQQFVTVNGILKLSDVDDLGLNEPNCKTDQECSQVFTEKAHVNLIQGTSRIPTCVNSICRGYNAQLNIWRAGHRFVKLLLPVSAPPSLVSHIQELLDGYDFQHLGPEWDTAKILATTEQLVDHFKSGHYLTGSEGIEKLGFREIGDGDLPGMFDYRCRNSVSAVSCVISVFNDVEAAQLCAKDTDCRAVVLSQERTWSGRTVAILKNGFASPSVKKGFTLLVKKDIL